MELINRKEGKGCSRENKHAKVRVGGEQALGNYSQGTGPLLHIKLGFIKRKMGEWLMGEQHLWVSPTFVPVHQAF